MGAVSDSIRRSAESFGCEIRTEAKVKKILVRGGKRGGRGARERRGAARAGRRHHDPPEDRVPRPARPPRAPRRLRVGHRAVEDALGHGEGERRDLRAARLHRGARQGAAGPPHRVGRAVPLARSTPSARSRTRTSTASPPAAPFVDGTIPTTLDKKLAPEGVHVFSMFTQWVPDDWNERAAPRRARRLRAADLRRVQRARAELQGLDHRLPGDRALRHGAGPRPDRREHLPRRADAWTSCSTCGRRPATPTSARRSAACTTGRAPRTAAAA